MTSITNLGWESIGTWLLSSSYVVAPMRLAAKRSSSGWTVRSFLATMYQLGFDLQAVPSIFWLNTSASGTLWVEPVRVEALVAELPVEALFDPCRGGFDSVPPLSTRGDAGYSFAVYQGRRERDPAPPGNPAKSLLVTLV